MEGRMTICNMSIEAGARAGLVAPDASISACTWDKAVQEWRELELAKFEKSVSMHVAPKLGNKSGNDM